MYIIMIPRLLQHKVAPGVATNWACSKSPPACITIHGTLPSFCKKSYSYACVNPAYFRLKDPRKNLGAGTDRFLGGSVHFRPATRYLVAGIVDFRTKQTQRVDTPCNVAVTVHHSSPPLLQTNRLYPIASGWPLGGARRPVRASLQN